MKSSSESRYFYRHSGSTRIEVARPVLSFFNLVEINDVFVFPRHQHFNYQLIFAKQGTYRCTVNDSPLTLRPGEIVIVKPGDWHEDYGRKGLRYHAVTFDLVGGGGARGIDLVFQSGIKPAQQVLRGKNQEIWSVVDRMQTEAERTDPFVAHLENALLLELFWHIIRALPRAHLSSVLLQQSTQQAFSERLRRIFDQYVEKRLDAGAMAGLLNVSVRTLTTHCRQVTGQSPMQAFMAHKMSYASELLRLTSGAVKDISYRLGFQNQYHFSRAFRRHCGVPPTAIRTLPRPVRAPAATPAALSI